MLDCPARYRGFRRIYRKRQIDFCRKLAKDRFEARQLFLRGDWRMAWPRRFRAGIDDVGPGFRKLLGVTHRGFGSKKFAAIGEGIRCDVQYAHDHRPCAEEAKEPVAALDHWAL